MTEIAACDAGVSAWLRVAGSNPGPPPRRPPCELAREQLAESSVARQVGDLRAGDVGGSSLVRRPGVAMIDTPRHIIGPQLAASGRRSFQLGEGVIDAPIAQRVTWADAQHVAMVSLVVAEVGGRFD